ncbi:MAG: hypothetical protein A3H96_05075 [Acidobacteria bacterium RIFCSPLOWO2_02_FULL_67_36]|nr:MAG: hypothetical protein A3H96_05075 [Acidobacteria bacterium RIFCSPLOWO2_02_FULL_67_36]OFW21620.1 MAG: hypothetical protein A3G21_14555 [Acidobacteria bacterium RIFCSPLOWO2_12_FULL_66_21]
MSRVVILSTALPLLLSTNPTQPIRVGVQTVAVYATVSDAEGRLVPDLTQGDFQVFDNGRAVAIEVFSSAIQPITVAVMLDMSGSMVNRFWRVRESTRHFVEALSPQDRARIGTFGYEIAISPILTGDKQRLRRVVDEELWPGGNTPLWNAVDVAMTSLADESGRRVILVLTDGHDTGDLPGFDTGRGRIERRAREEGFMVYAIGLQGHALDLDMASPTDLSGGGHFDLKDDADLTATFARVTAELRHQYTLGFTPAALDGKIHKLNVRLTRPGIKARARTSYLAAPQ